MTVFESITGYFGSDHLDNEPHHDRSNKTFHEEREEFLKRLYKGVEVKNRRYRFRKYKRCFVGSEAVDFMVLSGWAKSREDAVRIGRQLQTKFSLFEHVVDPERHLLEDDYLFYKFNDYQESQRDDDSTSHNSSSHHDDEDSPDKGRYQTHSLHVSRQLGLLSIGEMLRTGVKQKYNFSIDKEGFDANEAVDYMVSTGLANSRSDAVCIGLALQQAAGVIVNEKSRQEFDDAKLFFTFAKDREESWRKELEDAKDFFRNNMKESDHTFRLKVYKRTFTGTEAVDLLLMAGITSSRQDAVLLGRALMIEFNLFGHVTDEHEFEDTELFYKFSSNGK